LLHSAQLQQPSSDRLGQPAGWVGSGRAEASVARLQQQSFLFVTVSDRAVHECNAYFMVSRDPGPQFTKFGKQVSTGQTPHVPNFIALRQTIYETRKALQSFTPFSILAPHPGLGRPALPKFTNLGDDV